MVNRVLKYGLAAAVCALPMLLETTPAQAISYGKTQANGKVCRELFGPHMHRGHGSGATKAAAKAAAIKRWSGFTAWEYGKAWGNWSLAVKKSSSCKAGHRGKYRCKVKAQPCKS